MRHKKFFDLAILSLIIIVANLYAQSIGTEYFDNKWENFKKLGIKTEGNFSLIVRPMFIESVMGVLYYQWEEKRYSYDEIILKGKEFIKTYENRVFAILDLYFVGTMFSEGETSMKIPEDISEYISIENDSGRFLRCIETNISPWGCEVNAFNRSCIVLLVFPLKFPDTNESVFNNTDKIKFIVGGLGFKNNEFEYKVPFSQYYSDVPSNIKKFYYDLGIWKEVPEEKSKE